MTITTEPPLSDLYERYRLRIQAICLAYLHETGAAEDAAQEVFLRAGPRLRARRGDSVVAYLDGVARNVCREELRRRRHAAVGGSAAAEWAGEVIEPEGVAVDRRLIDGVWQQLSVRDRVLVFHRFAGYSYAEIGARLRISAKAVEMGLLRARRRARRLLDGLPAVVGLLGDRRRRSARVARRRYAARWLALHAPAPALLPAAVAAAVVLGAVSLRLQLVAPAPGDSLLAHALVPPSALRAATAAPDVDLQGLSQPFAPGEPVYASGYRHGCASQGCAVLYRSTEGGAHWTALPARGYAGGRVLTLPGRHGTLLADGPDGLQRSDDGGAGFRTVVGVPGPAAVLPGEAGHAVVVIAAQPLRLYDTVTGRVIRGASLPEGAVPLDVAAAGDGVDVAARLTASGAGGQIGSLVLHCTASGCTTVLSDEAAASFRFATSAGGAVIGVFSEHRIYTTTAAGGFTAVHDFGADTVAAMTLVRHADGSVVMLAGLWSARAGTGLLATSEDGWRHFAVRASNGAFWSVRGIAVLGDRILVAGETSGTMLESVDAGRTWASVRLPD